MSEFIENMQNEVNSANRSKMSELWSYRNPQPLLRKRNKSMAQIPVVTLQKSDGGSSIVGNDEVDVVRRATINEPLRRATQYMTAKMAEESVRRSLRE